MAKKQPKKVAVKKPAKSGVACKFALDGSHHLIGTCGDLSHKVLLPQAVRSVKAALQNFPQKAAKVKAELARAAKVKAAEAELAQARA